MHSKNMYLWSISMGELVVVADEMIGVTYMYFFRIGQHFFLSLEPAEIIEDTTAVIELTDSFIYLTIVE